MGDLAPPVVTAKPLRGREMKTMTIPTDVFDMSKKPAKKKGEEEPKEGKVELYHEGYVGGKLYLVPDSNLEAMKDIINFKMRPKTSTRYKHQTSFEISDFDRLQGKLGGLLSKLDNIEELHTDTDRNEKYKKSEEEENEEEEIEHDEFPQVESKSYSMESDKKPEIESQYEEKSKVEPQMEKKFQDKQLKKKHKIKQEPKKRLQEKKQREEECGVYYLRFLVSGHFKRDQKPIFIIQEYNGEPDIFKHQKADFFSKQKNGNVDVLLSGKFYSESILEELDGSPVALKTKPEKIKIDREKSKIYDNYFEKIYNMGNFDISMRGEFIKSELTNRVTPLVTLGVQKRQSYENPPKNPNYGTNIYNNTSPMTVLVYEPKYQSPFSKDLESIDNEDSASDLYTDDSVNDEYLTETESSVTEDDFHQDIKDYFSEPGPREYKKAGREKLNNSYYRKPNHSKRTLNDEHEVNSKDSANALETLNQNLKRKESKLSEKASPVEGFMDIIRGSSVFKTFFGNRTSKESSKIITKPNKIKDKTNKKTIKSSQATQLTKRNNRNENSPKVKSRKILTDQNIPHKM